MLDVFISVGIIFLLYELHTVFFPAALINHYNKLILNLKGKKKYCDAYSFVGGAYSIWATLGLFTVYRYSFVLLLIVDLFHVAYIVFDSVRFQKPLRTKFIYIGNSLFCTAILINIFVWHFLV